MKIEYYEYLKELQNRTFLTCNRGEECSLCGPWKDKDPQVVCNGCIIVIGNLGGENRYNLWNMMPKKARDLFERNFVVFHRETGVRAKRKELGLTQKELADRLGISQQFLSLVEMGVKCLSESKNILLGNTTKKGRLRG